MKAKYGRIFRLFFIVIFLIMTCVTCETYYFRSNYSSVNALIHSTGNLIEKPFLKAHLKSGDVCIFTDSWQVEEKLNLISGNGTRYDINRRLKFQGRMNINIDSVAIFETNKKLENTESTRIAILTILAALDLSFGIYCILNPKACFGSCPTFYIDPNSNFHYADAEGFSNAILPSLEYADIDALNLSARGSSFQVTMKNEALETHCVNDVQLLAYPVKKDQMVYHSNYCDFYLCENNYKLIKAKADEGDITDKLSADDKVERFSPSDLNNLSSKEEIYLQFDNVKSGDNLGLVLNFRQTLMTTYMIYSAMGYMGDEIGDIMAEMERNKGSYDKLKNGILKELGSIDVYVWNENDRKWDFNGDYYETGPIAVNHQILKFNRKYDQEKIIIKLVQNRGLWRIDYASLTNIKSKIEPHWITPNNILNKGNNNVNTLASIKDPKKYLVSMPGSEYKFSFELPDNNKNYRLFLYSKGYYLEWMRSHWFKDKDLYKLRQLVDMPKEYLRNQARDFKQYENQMEYEFWNSRIDTKTFSYESK